MHSRKYLPRILLILGFLSLLFIIKYKDLIKSTWLFNLEKARIYRDNFFYASRDDIKKRRPITVFDKEEKLRGYIGEPFISFNEEDWQEFWNLIYGAYPKEDAGPGLPKRLRQLTIDEIGFELMSRYPQTFAYFKNKDWEKFFGLLFRNES